MSFVCEPIGHRRVWENAFADVPSSQNRTCSSQDIRLKHITYKTTPCFFLALMVDGWASLLLLDVITKYYFPGTILLLQLEMNIVRSRSSINADDRYGYTRYTVIIH